LLVLSLVSYGDTRVLIQQPTKVLTRVPPLLAEGAWIVVGAESLGMVEHGYPVFNAS